MKNKDQSKDNSKVKDKKTGFLNAVIVILTIILFCIVIMLVVEIRPRGYSYGPDSAEAMIRLVERGKYADLLRSRYLNKMLGVNTSGNDAYAVPYAAADYYEAAFNYKGLMSADAADEASTYADKMSAARQALGKYTYIADDIDEFLK